MRFLDWQVSRYASPVTDLVYYIFICTTKSLRDKYYDEMIKIYHDSLSEMIARFVGHNPLGRAINKCFIFRLFRLGSDPAKLFPFDALQDQLRRYGKFALVMSTLLLPIVTSAADKCPDLDELAATFDNGEKNETSPFKPDTAVFNQRMRDVIIDLDRLGYI